MIYNGARTDKTYKASICPKFCGDDILGSHHLMHLPQLTRTTRAPCVVQCEGSAVRDGDFCCGTSYQETCRNNATNGLGLAPSASSGEAVSASHAISFWSAESASSSYSTTIPPTTTSLPSSPLLITLPTSNTSVPAAATLPNTQSTFTESARPPAPPKPNPESPFRDINIS